MIVNVTIKKNYTRINRIVFHSEANNKHYGTTNRFAPVLRKIYLSFIDYKNIIFKTCYLENYMVVNLNSFFLNALYMIRIGKIQG